MGSAGCGEGLRRLDDERGQTAAEYLGLILVLAALLAAIATADIGAQIRAGVEEQVCRTLSPGPCGDRGERQRADRDGSAADRARSQARRRLGRQPQLSEAALDRGGGSVPAGVTLRAATATGRRPGATTCFASVGAECGPSPGGAALPVPDEPSDLERLGEDVLGFLADARSALTYDDPARKLQRQRNLELLDDGLAFLEELNRQTAYSNPLAAGEGSNLGNELLGISDLRRAIKAAQEGDAAAAALYSAMAFPGFKLLKPTKELGEELAKRGTGATKGVAGRADEVHSALDPIARSRRTTSVLRTEGDGGRTVDVLAGGARDLGPSQRALAKPGEVLARAPGEHAEITALRAAMERGLKPRAIAATRDFCPACRTALERSGATILDPRTAVWGRR